MSAYHQKVQKGSHCIFHNINVFFQTLMDFFFFICHICHSEDKPENKCFLFFPPLQQSSLVLCGCHSLPEEDVPEKQPAWVDQ